jgi:flagellar basal body P-ring protein FlgI
MDRAPHQYFSPMPKNIPVRASLLACLLALAGACSPSKPQEARRVDPIVRDVPAALRGTIAAEASLRGVEPTLVSGLGIVVNLPGTGGGPYPAPVQATMERELGRRGLGRATQGEPHALAGRTPREVLDDKNVAVVLVEGVVPPGAPDGAVFDVRISALPGSGVTSLEGGTLWTTELRLGAAAPFGAAQARVIGEARGAVFINPFAEPGAGGPGGVGEDGINRQVGRVLGGGRVTDPLALELVLDNASHAKAGAIQNAINSRFPLEPGQQENTARGRNAQSIALRVPPSYKDRSAEFVRTLLGLRTEVAFSQEYAKRAAEELRASPGLAEDLEWVLLGIGKASVPFVAPLYDDAEFVPRLSALRVGARLGDARAGAPLRALAMDASQPLALRAEAADLMGYLGTDPSVDLALRELAGAPDLELRVAAMESLIKRNDPVVRRARIADKFELVVVPSESELIYVRQSGTPRVVLFGTRPSLRAPMLAGAWSDRLLVVSDAEGEPVRLMYRDPRKREAQQTVLSATSAGTLTELVRVLGHRTTPERPEFGLDLTYSQVVGALASLQAQGATPAAFAVEQDRLIDRLSEARAQAGADDRPESARAQSEDRKQRAELVRGPQQPTRQATPGQTPWVVPLPKRQEK